MAIAVDLAQDGASPMHSQIADSLRGRFERGDFHPGDHLPTTRDLARDLGVSRSTVVRAYEQLTREGWIEGRVGRGTLVSERTSPAAKRPNWDLLLTERVRSQSPEHADVLRMLSRTDLLSFAGGLPSPEFYPEEAFLQITSEVMRNQGARLLQWCPVDGYPPLRSWIAERLGCSPDCVLVLAGSTQGLHLVSQALVEPGDAVLVEAPTYAGALRSFRAAGARVLSVPCGSDGIDLRQLEATLDHVRAKFLYIVPTYHNPTGSLLPLDKRRDLLALCAERGVPIVEDDAYASLRFDGPQVPTLQSLDANGLVIYVSTFSKAVFPGIACRLARRAARSHEAAERPAQSDRPVHEQPLPGDAVRVLQARPARRPPSARSPDLRRTTRRDGRGASALLPGARIRRSPRRSVHLGATAARRRQPPPARGRDGAGPRVHGRPLVLR